MNIGTVFRNVNLYDNTAQFTGGALFYSASHCGLIFDNASFVSNSVSKGRGGAIFLDINNGIGQLLSGNEMSIFRSEFINNSGTIGGGIYTNENNVVIIHESLFLNNMVTTNGGAILVYSANNVTITKTVFNKNTALKTGGGISSSSLNKLYASETTFLNNIAHVAGGALFLRDNTYLRFHGFSLFQNNSAFLIGGAICIVSSPQWAMATNSSYLHMYSNSASRGSAIFYQKQIKSLTNLNNILFEDNFATIGGTVFWMHDSLMLSEPSGMHSESLTWKNNTALVYGIKFATQATQMLGPRSFRVNDYNKPLAPSLVFLLYDYYNQYISINGTTSIIAYISPPLNENTNCTIPVPYLSGSDLIGSGLQLSSGVVSFSNLQAFCSPGGSLNINFEAHLGSAYDISPAIVKEYYIQNSTTLYFRNCIAGEQEINGECVQCSKGSYNFIANKECISCMGINGVEDCYANQLILSEGFWRRYVNNSAVLKCPLASESCLGGSKAGLDSCGMYSLYII
jgi:predicted outer membrane repeat protein